MMSAPAASTAFTSSPSRARSADRMLGAISGLSGLRGMHALSQTACCVASRALLHTLRSPSTEPHMGLAIALHILAAVVWVGGMFFAVVCLRPALGFIDPPLRLRIWSGVLSRFFRWAWASAAVLLITGVWMVFGFFQGLKHVGVPV